MGWINGGFFVFNSKVFDFIKNDRTFLEREPLQKLCKIGELMHFNIEGFGNVWIQLETNKLLKKF